MRGKGVAGLIFALWVAEITGSFETAMIYAALKALIADFKDPVLVGWLVTTYLLIGAGAAAMAGRLGDIYGRRRVLMILLAVGVIGSLMSAFSINYAMLLAGRALQGLTGAILPLTIGLVRENMPKERVPMGIGLMISGASAGTAAGLVIGGLIVDSLSWHGVFMASAAFAAVSFILTFALVPQSTPKSRDAPLDWLGGILFVPATLSLLLAISNGPK
ncbi:MAG: MFS transporter, partial [Rhizorhabdus sp.]